VAAHVDVENKREIPVICIYGTLPITIDF